MAKLTQTLIILSLPILCQCNIKLSIIAASNRIETKINFTGNHQQPVSGNEVNLFNITTPYLNRGLRVELGRIPNDVYLTDPTPYGKLFEKFHWQQVVRKTEIVKVRIVDIFKEPLVLEVQEHSNNTTRPTKAKLGITTNVLNTVTTRWPLDGMPPDKMAFDVNITYKTCNTTVVFKNKWQRNYTQEYFVDFGLTKEGHFILKPQQTVRTVLYALKCMILLEIEYLTSVLGQIIANYEDLYGKYHFYAPTLKNIMRAANLNNKISSKQLLEVRFYSDGALYVYVKNNEQLDIVTPASLFKTLNKH